MTNKGETIIEMAFTNLALSPLPIAAAICMLSYVRVLLHTPTELANLDSNLGNIFHWPRGVHSDFCVPCIAGPSEINV